MGRMNEPPKWGTVELDLGDVSDRLWKEVPFDFSPVGSIFAQLTMEMPGPGFGSVLNWALFTSVDGRAWKGVRGYDGAAEQEINQDKVQNKSGARSSVLHVVEPVGPKLALQFSYITYDGYEAAPFKDTRLSLFWRSFS